MCAVVVHLVTECNDDCALVRDVVVNVGGCTQQHLSETQSHTQQEHSEAAEEQRVAPHKSCLTWLECVTMSVRWSGKLW